MLNPPRCNRTPRLLSLATNTDQSVVCLTRDQRIAGARKAQLSEVRSNSDSTPGTEPSSSQRRRRRCFRGVSCRTVEQDRAIRPLSQALTMGESWCDLPPAFRCPKSGHTDIFCPDYSPAAQLTCPTAAQATLLKSQSQLFSGSPQLFASCR